MNKNTKNTTQTIKTYLDISKHPASWAVGMVAIGAVVAVCIIPFVPPVAPAQTPATTKIAKDETCGEVKVVDSKDAHNRPIRTVTVRAPAPCTLAVN